MTLLSAALLVLMASTAQAASVVVPLGTAKSFVVLAGAGITNTGPTTLNGDIGTFPTTSVSGAGSMTITGVNHAGDSVTQGAKSDLVTGYDVAAGELPRNPVSSDLGGQTLTKGVYNSASSMGLTGALTLDAEGDPDAVFVFQAGSTLTTASASSVLLTNGAQACNVFWQVGSSATLGTGSSFNGTILALTSITATTGATIIGRLLARNGAVTLDTNTITRPSCTVTPPTGGTTSTGGTPTGGTTSTGGTPSGGSTTGVANETISTPANGQITRTPGGPVGTGSGAPSAGTRTARHVLPAALILAAAGGSAFVMIRRRTRRPH